FETFDKKVENPGTVILTSGSGGVYEQHKREIASFLFKGMNVMTFNFRGHNLSEGEPSAKGVELDTEAAYQYVKQKTGVDDKKIVLKSFCISGGPAAKVAGKHRNVNIILDQTYASFNKLVEDIVKKSLKKHLKKLAILVYPFIKFI